MTLQTPSTKQFAAINRSDKPALATAVIPMATVEPSIIGLDEVLSELLANDVCRVFNGNRHDDLPNRSLCSGPGTDISRVRSVHFTYQLAKKEG